MVALQIALMVLAVQPPVESTSVAQVRSRRAGGIVLGTLSAAAFVAGSASSLAALLVPRDPHDDEGMVLYAMVAGSIIGSGAAIASSYGAGKLLGQSDAGLDVLSIRAPRDRPKLRKAGLALVVISGAAASASLIGLLSKGGQNAFHGLVGMQMSFTAVCSTGLGMLAYANHYRRTSIRLRPTIGGTFVGLAAAGRF